MASEHSKQFNTARLITAVGLIRPSISKARLINSLRVIDAFRLLGNIGFRSKNDAHTNNMKPRTRE
jgi:hypothetical protein